MTTAADIKAFLQSLGNTDKDVAVEIREAGLTGRRFSGSLCPVAKLVKRQFPDLPDFALSRTGFTIYQTNGTWTERTPIDESWGVGRFISEFDNGFYPEFKES